MAVYALMLAGSNFFAPIIAGFINDGQGWRWVQYWCAIFCGIGFVICFFFMEETNYDRAPLEMKISPVQTPGDVSPVGEKSDLEKSANADVTTSQPVDPIPIESYQPKTYLQKLKLLDKPRPFRVGRMMVRPLIFVTFPVIAYAGFSYGSNLVWFNVLNGTTSLILAGPPYNFSVSPAQVIYLQKSRSNHGTVLHGRSLLRVPAARRPSSSPLHRPLRRLGRPPHRSPQQRRLGIRAQTLALLPLPPDNPRLSHSMGRRRLPPYPLVRSHRRHVRHRCRKHNRYPTQRLLLYR